MQTYFLPAHILAGNADIQVVKQTGVDYAWLTKQEIEEKLAGSDEDTAYWQSIGKLLSD